MRRFYSFIVKHKYAVLAVFAPLFVLCLILGRLVSVNYDINDYLPPDTHSTVSISVMSEEFSGGIPNTRVMVKDVTVPEALQIKEKIKGVEGVTSVTWLDDAADIRTPLSMLDEDTVRSYYRDSTALFTVTIDEEYYIPATEDIRELIGDDNRMTGSSVSIAATTTGTVAEIGKIASFAVLFVFAVLIFTTYSWLDPLLVLGGLGVAIVINSGTNIIFGEISFVTNAAGAILQLAVSLDYSVFLLHRFKECRDEIGEPGEAMVDALVKSTSSILSSGLTTVIGFLALVLMQFRIGPDLGLALAKGVVISLLTVFVFTPALILAMTPVTDKLTHKPFTPKLNGFGRFVRRITVPMTVIFAVIIIPAFLASNSNSYLYGASHILGEKTQAGADAIAIDEAFGESDTMVLLVPNGDMATEASLSRELHALPHVTGIISYVDTVGAEIPTEYLDPDTLSQLISPHYSRMVISTDLPAESEQTFSLVGDVRRIASKYYPDKYYLAGQGVSTFDLKETVTSDLLKINLLAIAAVFVILVITMRSVFLPVILVLSIETAIWINLAVPYFSNDSIFYIAYLIISTIQLGSTVDYAILMTDRYRENRQMLSKTDSLIKTVADVTVSILTSGSALTVVGLLLGFISTNRLLAQLGIFIGRGAIFSLLIVFLVLPGLLCLCDRLVVKRDRGEHNKEKTITEAAIK